MRANVLQLYRLCGSLRDAAPLGLWLGAAPLALWLGAAPLALAGTPTPSTVPTGGSVTSGQAVISAPTSNATGGQRLQIDQASQRAVIQWNTFDIGSQSEVRFNQPNAGASVLNRILDANPSVIQGRLSANGQVFLINHNGIIFDRGSQVNVHTLMATTLDMDDELFNRLGLVAGNGTPALMARDGIAPAGVTLKGVIETPAGGAVYVLAPTVRNEGVIRAPDGQIILAAGNVAYLYENPVTSDVSMRGLLVEVKAADGDVNLTSLVTNTGQISAARGNVTLAGLAVNQMGSVSASTAALQNGSVWLLSQARGENGGIGRSGRVTLGAGSVTETPIDTEDTTTLAEDQNYDPYRAVIRVEGKVIDHAGAVRSPGGRISFIAFDAQDPSAIGTSRIHLGENSIIDAAGNWADLALERNLLSIKLTSNELKDAPVQKDGFLPGQTVAVDLRRGTTLFDISGYAAGVKRSVAEKAAAGGDIVLESRNGDIVQRAGSVLDVSGGGYRFAGGTLATTQLVTNGRTVDIAVASPDAIYEGTQDLYVQSFTKWGVRETFARPGQARRVAEGPSVEGKSAGGITVSAPGGVVLEGTLRGGAIAGQYQVATGKLPRAGRFVGGDIGVLDSAAQDFKLREVIFSSGAQLGAGYRPFSGAQDEQIEVLPESLRGNLSLSAGLFKRGAGRTDGGFEFTGFGDVALLANDRIAIPAGMRLDMAPGGALLLVSKEVRIDGSIVAPAGSVEARAAITASTLPGTPRLQVSDGARIDTAGLWINEAASVPANVLPRLLNGGTIRLSGFNAVVERGAALDVSGGGALSTRGTLTRGDGGLLRFAAGTGAGQTDAFEARLAGSLHGYALGRGATLEISTGRVRITESGAGAVDEMLLDPRWASTGGFARHTVDGRFGLVIDDNTRIDAVIDTLVLDRSLAALSASGSALEGFTSAQRLPLHERAPVSLSLASSDLNAGSIVMGAGARISTDPKAVVSLSSPGGIDLRGRIEAPAGEIRLNVDGGASDGLLRNVQLRLASGSALISRGAVVRRPSNLGLEQGDVLDAGVVSLSTFKNSLVIEAGSLIDISAVSQVLDVPSVGAVTATTTRREVWGNAGTVSIRTTQGARLEGDIVARPAGTGAGGNFGLDLVQHGDLTVSPLDASTRRIVVTQDNATGPAPEGFVEAYVPLRRLADAGFEKVRLRSQDSIEFRGDLDLRLARALRLDAAQIAAAGPANIALSAPRIELGGSGDPANPLASSPVVGTTFGGQATLRVQAGTAGAGGVLDAFGTTTLNGFDSVSLRSAGDLRLTGKAVDDNATDNLTQATRIIGALNTGAPQLELAAARIYPTSASEFRVTQVADPGASGVAATTTIRRTVRNDAAVASAAGSLTIAAPVIVHDGDLRAPLGSLSLEAAQSLTFTSESFTSVSALGQEILFGTTVAGREWFYGGMAVTELPGKRISLGAPNVSVAQGARLDIAGGGDIRAVEFIPGPGGSQNTLLRADTYAILPGAGDAFGPFDLHLAGLRDLGFGADRNVYDSVYLAGSPALGLAAGRYTLLPGYYALLPGAFVVRPSGDARLRDLASTNRTRLTTGAEIIAGYRTVAGSNVAEARWSGFTVLPGEAARRASEYRYSSAEFFAKVAATAGAALPSLPRDAGQLVLGAGQTLQFAGSLSTAPAAGGRVAEVDITAARIAITASATQPVDDGYLRLDAPTLSSFGASLLIGGRRTHTAAGTVLDVVAGDIVVANDATAPVRAPEVLLAATGAITVLDGARISAQPLAGSGGASATAAALSDADLIVRNAAGGADGALLRVSVARQVGLRRDNPALLGGELAIARGAQLSAPGSILLDATARTVLQIAGDAAPAAGFRQLDLAQGGDLALGAANIKLGFNGSSDTSLVLDNVQLAALSQSGSLRLRSYSSLDLYGDASLGDPALARLEIDAPALFGWRQNGTGTGAILQAGHITLINRGATAPAGVIPDGDAALILRAQTLVLGEGAKSVNGFSALSAQADQILMRGTGTLDVAADVTLNAGRLTAQGATTQSVRAVGPDGRVYALAVGGNGAATTFNRVEGLGARLNFSGRTVNVASRIDAAAGSITLESLGQGATDGITLDAGAQLNAGAAVSLFGSQTAVADAGSIVLKASGGGGVIADAGASLDLSGAAEGGDAGTLRIEARAADAPLVLNAVIRAAAPAGRQGRFVLDADRVPDFSLLNARLNVSGFTRSRDLRVRNGDLVIQGEDGFLQRPADRVVAREIRLAADRGDVIIDGILDASAVEGGGNVKVFAGRDLVLGGGGKVLAQGTATGSQPADPYAPGGDIELFARDGQIRLDSSGLIDISAGAKGDAGRVVFSAPRTVNNDDVAATLAGTVRAATGAGGKSGRVIIEGRRSHAVSVVDGNVSTTFDAALNPVWGDYDAFMAAIATRTHGLKNADGSAFTSAVYRAGVDLKSDNDLALASAWDLTQPQWNRMQQAGRVSLRSARNLQIQGALGLPDDDAVGASSWALQLTGGADFSAADPLAVRDLRDADHGDVRLAGAAARVRASDGDIDIVAGRDFVIADPGAAVITTGVIAGDDSRFTTAGGRISISARRDARGTPNTPWINDWLRRTTLPTLSETVRLRGAPGEWWVHRSMFRHNIGALGGGNIAIEAGNDIAQLSAMSPTSGRVYSDANGQSVLEVLGGGDLDLSAGGGISGGEYLIGRSAGRLQADGDIGGRNARVALFVMGEHHDTALRGASLTLVARGDIFLQNVSNPTILPLSLLPRTEPQVTGFGRAGSAFLTYAPESALRAISVLGDININNAAVRKTVDVTWSIIAPPSVTLASLSGNVRNDNVASNQGRIYLHPSATGALRVLAKADIDGVNFEGGDTLLSALPTWRAVAASNVPGSVSSASLPIGLGVTAPRDVSATAGAALRYSAVAVEGDILNARFFMPRASEVSAGRDIINTKLYAQNLLPEDRSTLIAGRDIRYVPVEAGKSQENVAAFALAVGGPGTLLVRAGRDIDLGTSQGLAARGAADNASLGTPASARLIVAAGARSDISGAQSDALFAELLAAGGAIDTVRANAAIAALFPKDSTGPGNLSMVFSRIRTEGGSGIDLLVPEGNIEAGLTTAAAGDVGIVTTLGGAIRTFLSGDFNINQSKVLTVQGGDILAYSSRGSIDAGRGARDSRSTQPPRRNRDPQTGLTTFVFPVDVAGSGIRTLTSDPDGAGPLPAPRPGDVFLFAPSGTINAGEAGIASAGNIVVAALVVLNATNISASGSSSGVPVAPTTTAAASLASSGSSTASASRAAEDSTRAAGGGNEARNALAENFRPTFINVELLGMGS